MKIGIVGGGVVGHATARCYMEFAEVRVFDVQTERATHTLGQVLACDVVFVCLPTPQKTNSLECDLSAIEGFFDHGLDEHQRSCNFVLRSTVPIGTTRRLAETYRLPNLAHSPEFLTARCSVIDAMLPARNIIGVPVPGNDPEYPTFTGKNRGAQTLGILYHQRFPHAPCLFMSSDESEAVKLFQNGFFANSVAYWNEARELSDKVGMRWDSIINAILADGRISPSHCKVPGHHGWGFSGACLPKDIANLTDCIIKADLASVVCKATIERNSHDQARNK